jgi:hypothetical protein
MYEYVIENLTEFVNILLLLLLLLLLSLSSLLGVNLNLICISRE